MQIMFKIIFTKILRYLLLKYQITSLINKLSPNKINIIMYNSVNNKIT